MKPPIFLLLFISSFAALLALPLSVELAVSPIVLSGLALIMHGDYRHRPALRCPTRCAQRTPEHLRLAA